MIDAEITQFVADDYRRILGCLVIMCGSVPAAEDALQEALARAWERSRRGENIESLEGWVLTVARNLTRSARRRWFAELRARDRLTESADPLNEDGEARASERLTVLAAIRELTVNQREAIGLTYFAGYSIQEVGTVMGMNEGAVRALLFRARQTLKRSLDPEILEGESDVRAR